MRSSFLGLEVSKRSISLSQKALDITMNNLSNVKTEGYTRQRLDTNSMHLSTYNNFQTRLARLSIAGQGVNAYGVSQVRDAYVDKRYRETTCNVAEFDVKTSVFSEVETILDNVDSVGLAKSMDVFKNALSSYASNSANNEEMASIVRNQAYNITTMLHGYDTELNKLLDANKFQMDNAVESMNVLLDKIVNYNNAIVHGYSTDAADRIFNDDPVLGAYGPNELIDQRNVLVDELSYYGNIHVENNNNGSLKISMGNTTIVDDDKVTKIMMKKYEDFNAEVLTFTNGDPVAVSSGELKAYTDLLNGNGPYANFYQNSEYGIPYYKTAIDAFATSFAELMNQMNGTTDDDLSRAMFASSDDRYDDFGKCTYRADINAANIKISDEWMKDSTMIGRVYDEKEGEWVVDLDGNNANKLLLAFDNSIRVGRASDFEGSIYDYVLFVSNRLGQGSKFNSNQYDIASSSAEGLLSNRESISGVSETEEGINMMDYQKWFNASSRMMTTLDECLDKIINGMGRVGL